MAFQRPALADLVTRIEADYVSRLVGGGSLLRRSVVKVFARVHAGAVHLVYGYAFWISKQIMPDTAEKENLERWARIWNVLRKPATFAVRDVTFTGTEGNPVPIGTELVSSDGTLYRATAAGTITAGSAVVSVTAETVGTAGNVDTGTVLQLNAPVAGISSAATVAATNAVDGAAVESDASLLARLLNRIQLPPYGGSQNDYVQWALQVSGVTRAWCLPQWLGDGTVGVTFVRDDDVGSIIPSAGEVAAVQAYITDPSRKPVPAKITTFAPTADPLNFTISGIADATVRLAVQAELEDLIKREASPGGVVGGGTLLLSHIQESISKAQDEVDHVLTAPAANVVAAAGHLTTMGVITWL